MGELNNKVSFSTVLGVSDEIPLRSEGFWAPRTLVRPHPHVFINMRLVESLLDEPLPTMGAHTGESLSVDLLHVFFQSPD